MFDDESVLLTLRDLQFKRGTNHELRKMTEDLVRNFSKISSDIMKIQVCQHLQSPSLTYYFLLDSMYKKLPSQLLEPLILQYFQTATHAKLCSFIDMMIQRELEHEAPEAGEDVNWNPIPFIFSLVTNSYIQTQNLYPVYMPQVIQYWCQQILNNFLNIPLRVLGFVLQDILQALLQTFLVTPEMLQQCWNLSDYYARYTISDVISNNLNHIQLRTDARYAPILREVEAWRVQHNRHVNDEYQHSHSIHMLDKYRQKYLLWLKKQSESFTVDDYKAGQKLAQSYYGSFQGAREIKMATGVFSAGHIQMTMQDIFEYILIVFHRIVPTVALEDNDEMKKLVEKRQLAFKRLEDELNDMKGTCHSGHLNRIFNATVGIFEGALGSEVDYEKRSREIFNQLIANMPQDEMDELFEGMVQTPYTDEVNQKIQSIATEAYELLRKEVSDDYVVESKHSFLKAAEDYFKTSVSL